MSTPTAWAGSAFVDAQQQVHYDASAGQANVVLVDQQPGVTTISDAGAGATIAAGSGCATVAASVPTVQCTTPPTGMTALITGGDGDDQIRAQGVGAVGLDGGPGNDTLVGGPGADALQGGDGDDRIIGGGGCLDLLAGGAGNDTIVVGGGSGAYGGDGDDTFVPGPMDCAAGNDIHGEAGIDTFDASPRPALTFIGGTSGAIGWSADAPAGVTLDNIANDGPVGSPASNVRSDVENVTGGPESDVLIGSDAANVLDGGAGNDRLDGGAGPDSLIGGAGKDLADYSSRTAAVNVSLDGVANDGAAGEQDNVATDVEDLKGGSGNDTLTGDAADNTLDGGRGADTMTGGAGLDVVDYSTRTADVTADLSGSPGNDGEAGEGDTIGSDVEGLVGGGGNDTLTGNAADGVLFGGDGSDRLFDRGGKDLISGGNGADFVFALDGAVDDVICGMGRDVVNADAADVVESDCETVTRGDQTQPNTLLHSRRPARYTQARSAKFVFSSSMPGSTFSCSFDGLARHCAKGSLTLPWLANGLHIFVAIATSPNGIQDRTPVVIKFRVDTVKPRVTVKLPRAGCVGNAGTSLLVTALDASPVRITARLGSKTLKSTAKRRARVRLTRGLLARYGTRVRLTVRDRAGNTSRKFLSVKRC